MTKDLGEGGGSEFYRHQVKEADATTSKGTLAVFGEVGKKLAKAAADFHEKWQAEILRLSRYPTTADVTLWHRLKAKGGYASQMFFGCEYCGRTFAIALELAQQFKPGAAVLVYECPNHLADGVEEKGSITVSLKRPKGARFVVPCRRSVREGERLEKLLRPKWEIVGP